MNIFSFVIVVITLVFMNQQAILTITQAKTEAGTISSCQLYMYRGSNPKIINNPVIAFTLPNSFAFANEECQESNDGINFTSVVCTLKGSQLQISYSKSITNPPYFKLNIQLCPFSLPQINNYYLTMQMLSTTGVVQDSAQNSFTVTPSKMSCLVNIVTTTVLAQSQIQVIIKPTLAINEGSQLSLGFHTTWENDRISNLPIRTTSFKCSTDQIGNQIVNCQEGTSQNNILSAITIGTNGEGSLYYWNILNPSTTNPNSPFSQISLVTSQGWAIQICTPTPLITNLTPMQIPTPTLTAACIINLSLISSLKFLQGDQIQITFPTNIDLTKVTSVSLFGVTVPFTTSTNSLIFSPKTQTQYNMQFNVNSIITPSSIKPYPFTISIYRDSQSQIQSYQGSLSISSLQTGQLINVALTITNTQISAVNNYQISFIFSNKISTNGYVKIHFPTGFAHPKTTCLVQKSVSPQPLCTIVDESNGFYISTKNINFNTEISSQTSLTISLNNIQNPASTGFSGSIQITTFYSTNDDQVDQGQYQIQNFFTPGTLTNIQASVAVNSLIGQLDAVYTFQFMNQFVIPEGGQIQIIFPKQIIPYRQNFNVLFNENSIAASVLGLTLSIQVPQQISSGSSNILIISNGIQNPLTSQQTGQFTIQTMNENQYKIDIGYANGIIVLNPNYLQGSITIQNPENNAISNYIVQITPSINLVDQSWLVITIPPELQIQNPLTISSTNKYLKQITNTIVNQQKLIMMFQCSNECVNSQIPSTTISLTIQSIRNSQSFKPTSPFNFETFSDSQLQMISCKINPTAIPIVATNTLISSFANLQLSISPLFRHVQATYTFTMSFPVTFPQYSLIKIQFPTTIQLPASIDCTKSYSGFISPPSCQLNGQSVILNTENTILSANSQISFILPNIINPITESQPILISTFSVFENVQYAMQSNSKVVQYINNCQLPCKDCLSGSNSVCESCYQDSSVSNLQYFVVGQGICVAECSTGYVNVGIQCQKCGPNCENCIMTTSITCNLCLTNYYLQGNQCVQECSEGLFKSGQVCLPCEGGCLACINTSTTCIKCKGSLFLTSSTCVESCPSNLFGQNGECVGCTAPCQYCKDQPNICTKCNPQSTTPYLLGKTCLSTCSNGYYNNLQNGSCEQCVYPCGNCSSQHVCLSCLQSKQVLFLFNSGCISECPAQYYGDQSECKACQDVYCNICNKSGCQVCNNSKVVLEGKCADMCPENYILSSDKKECLQKTIAQLLEQNLGKYIPVPFLIIFFFLLTAVIASKCHKPETFVPGCIIGLGGILEWGSWVTLFFLSIFMNNQVYQFQEIIFLATLLGVNLIFNIINYMYYNNRVLQDEEYQKWSVSNNQNKFTCKVIKFLGFLCSFKISRTIYCKFFSFTFFKAKLSNTTQLKPFNILNGLSIIFLSAPAIFIGVFIAYYDNQKTQLFVSAFDCIFITFLMIMFTIWETQKHPDFFEEQAYYHTLQKVYGQTVEDSEILQKDSKKKSVVKSSFINKESDRPIIKNEFDMKLDSKIRINNKISDERKPELIDLQSKEPLSKYSEIQNPGKGYQQSRHTIFYEKESNQLDNKIESKNMSLRIDITEQRNNDIGLNIVDRFQSEINNGLNQTIDNCDEEPLQPKEQIVEQKNVNETFQEQDNLILIQEEEFPQQSYIIEQEQIDQNKSQSIQKDSVKDLTIQIRQSTESEIQENNNLNENQQSPIRYKTQPDKMKTSQSEISRISNKQTLQQTTIKHENSQNNVNEVNNQIESEDEMVKSLDDPEWDRNQVSPNEFNEKNQRFEDEQQKTINLSPQKRKIIESRHRGASSECKQRKQKQQTQKSRRGDVKNEIFMDEDWTEFI